MIISNVLKKQLVKGKKGSAVRNGKLYFTSVTIGKTGVQFFYKGKPVVLFPVTYVPDFSRGETLNLNLDGGHMRFEII